MVARLAPVFGKEKSQFLQGFCKYGNNCKYYHPVQTIQRCAGVFPGDNCSTMHTSTSVVSSMQSVNVLQSGGPVTKDQLTNQVSVSLINLPPSLRPPHGGGYQPLPFIDWG
ncbi:hypothetical protein SUGI_0741420 [Cryptomeria japonica]|nr:hypothetical protein SUGI_0741420 [Cryptomeria japonica]